VISSESDDEVNEKKAKPLDVEVNKRKHQEYMKNIVDKNVKPYNPLDEIPEENKNDSNTNNSNNKE
jgi:hypothetical protein